MEPEMQARTTSEVATLDNLSRLPDSVIHHIYSFLSARDITRTSILSKAWYRISALYACIFFHFVYTKTSIEEEYDEEIVEYPKFIHQIKLGFLSMIGKSILHRLQREFTVHRFQLYINFPYMDLLAPRLDQWLCLPIEKNVTELVVSIDCLSSPAVDRFSGPRIDNSSAARRSYYTIPQVVAFARCLKLLSLVGCRFEGSLDIKLPQLQKLLLCHSCFADRFVFERLLSGCPVIEYIKLSFCNWRDQLLFVPNLPELKYFECLCCDMVDIIKINAKNLHTFLFTTSNGFWPRTIDLENCSKALKELKFFTNIGNCRVDDLQAPISQLPFLEILEVRGCRCCRNFKISSQTLKRLFFKDCCDLSVSQIDTPSLQLLEFVNCDELFLPINASNQLQIHFSFVVREYSVEWLLTLKDFLMTLKSWENLKLIIYPEHQNKITDELSMKSMIINDKLSELMLEKLKGLSSNPNQEQRLIHCEVDTSESIHDLMDPGSEFFTVKRLCIPRKTPRVTFKWKYDASQRRVIV